MPWEYSEPGYQFVPCGCEAGVLRVQACGIFQEPLRWWKPYRCAGCGHYEPCHTRVQLDMMVDLVDGHYTDTADLLQQTWLSNKVRIR